MNKFFSCLAALCIVVIFLISLTCGSALAAEYVLKFGATVQEDSASGISMTQYFKPYVEEKSNGRISVEVYCNSILGGDRQLYESIQVNTV